MNLVELIKTVRAYRPGSGLLACRKAAEASDGTIESALAELDRILRDDNARAEHVCRAGRIFSYLHNGGVVGVILELRSETDFVTRNELFEQLGKDLCLQVVASENPYPQERSGFYEEVFIKDPTQTVRQKINSVSSMTGERIEISKICRFDSRKVHDL